MTKSAFLVCFMIALLSTHALAAEREANPEVVALLEELVELRETAWETKKLQVGQGLSNHSELVEAKGALVEARINLARELGQSEVIIGALAELVESQREMLKLAMALYEDGRVTLAEVKEVEIKVKKTEVRLLREREKGKG